MILIYYKDDNGAVVSHHPARDGRTLEQLQAAAEEYNSKRPNTRKAYIKEIQEDSLEMYLLNYAEKQKRFTEESVQAAKDAIREALDCIDCLEVAK